MVNSHYSASQASACRQKARIVEPASIEPHFAGSVVVSIVSHGHGLLVQHLLRQIAEQEASCIKRIILTLNVPEPKLQQALEQKPLVNGVELQIISNPVPCGFGRNHNKALQAVQEEFVCILNPDMALLQPDSFGQLSDCLAVPDVGLAYPVLIGPDGMRQDNERTLPTFFNLLRRRVLGRVENRVDWVSGACLMLRAADWRLLGGFDERFYMYCEDVDLSLRVRQEIGELAQAPVCLQHQAQRASRRQWQHLWWHLQSMWLLWRLPSFQWAKANPSSVWRKPAQRGG